MTYRADFTIRALGGLGEIGMNCLVVETEGRLLVIDCGVMFASSDFGIDLIHPDFNYLVERRDDIDGVVLTHAHEDHLSGLPFLLREIDVPVFGGSYSTELLKLKVQESEHPVVPMTRLLTPGGSTEIGPFRVETFLMPHSVVQNTGLVIDMPKGRILHTGDFKLGVNREDRGEGVLSTLEAAAKDGVDLMLADSTGAEETEPVGEESEVLETFDRLFNGASGRIFVALFSSNIRRLESVMKVAKKHDRKVGLLGRSVQNHVRIAEATSELLVPPGILVPAEKLADMQRSKTVLVVSGTQGEVRSALARLATGNHHILEAEKEDVVLLSSRFIPGNELTISRMIDRLLARGTRVHHRQNTRQIHVSGHGGQAEIAAAVRTVAPRCFLPIHGTLRHLVAGADIAREEGTKQVAVVVNGQSASCSDGMLSVTNGVCNSGRVYVDAGGRIDAFVLRERHILGSSGTLIVALALDETRRVKGQVDVQMKGLMSENASSKLKELVADKVRETSAQLADEQDLDDIAYREAIRVAVRKLVVKKTKRDPFVIVCLV